MNSKKTIDQDSFAGWQHYVFREEDILWTGKPDVKLSIRFLEQDFYHDVATGATSVLTIYIIFLVSLVYGFHQLENNITAILIAVAGIILPFLYEVQRYRNGSKTAYAITEKYVLFKFFNGFRYKIHAIPTGEIIKLHHIKNNHGLGTVFLITDQQVSFNTHNSTTGTKRDHPSLENIRNSDTTVSILKKILSKHPKKQLRYQEPVITGNLLKTVKTLFILVISLMAVYLADFYILPSQKITDIGDSAARNMATPDPNLPAYDMGGQYITQNGYTYSTKYFYPELNLDELKLQISPIFKIVKGLSNQKMDYTDRLSSSLNDIITQIAYLFTFFVICGGYLMLRNKSVIRSELFWKITMAAIGFLGILILLWRVNN